MTVKISRSVHATRQGMLLAAASLAALTLGTSAAWAAPDLQAVAPTPDIIISSPGTTTTDISAGVNGIGQMVVDEKNGFIGLCTGTLINPRTVLFAGHCVNSLPASGYGANNGGLPIGFFFNSNNNVAGNSAIGQWLNGVSGGPKDLTRTGNYAYNVNYVAYNPASALPGNTFLYSDIAVATLDTVAANVPTWSVLFSPLPDPGTIGASGTGYHVTIEGYGTKGAGAAGGNGGIDYKRRVANNTIGALTSLNNFEGFLFGANDNLPQNLYFLDFDDPNRGTANASPYDFNALRDNAVPNEGITGPGDSGGPLILDTTFSKQVVIGTLSGGYAAFFNGQPSYSYGAVSFYQPVYLYWDWIVANDHYHYTGALPGNGSWTDPTHWAARLDPNFTIIQGGVLVNGLPGTPGGGTSDTSGQFGQICYQAGGLSDCYDVHTGIETFDPSGHPIGTSGTGNTGGVLVYNDHASVSAGSLDSGTATPQVSGASAGSLDPVSPTPDGPGGLPLPTLANGLPGATNFVPNNIDSVGGSVPQYFDVTLDQAGLTTLSGASIVIDNLTLNNSAGLNIAPTGSLTVNIGVGQYATSSLNVDGTLNSSDYTLAGGLLTGNGTINLGYGGTVFPSTTKLLTVGNNGAFSPGTTSTTGTLTVNGNMFVATAGTYLANVSAAGTDRINVSGLLGFYGQILVSPIGAPFYHEGGIIASAGQIVTTGYTVPDTIAGVLYPVVTLNHVGANDVLQLSIEAASYSTQFTARNTNEAHIASALDADRPGSYGPLSSIYNAIDGLTGNSLADAFDQLLPNQQFGYISGGRVGLNQISNLLQSRLSDVRFAGAEGGTGFAFNGTDGLTLAMNQNNALENPLTVATNGGQGFGNGPAAVHPALGGDGHWGGFLTASGINGSAHYGTADKDITGYVVMGGLDRAVDTNTVLGAAFSISQADADLPLATGKSTVKSYQGTFYGAWSDNAQDFFVTGFAGYGGVDANATRFATIGGTVYSAVSSPSGAQANAGLTIGTVTPAWYGMRVYPQGGVEYDHFHTDAYTETGSAIAMHVNSQSADQLLVRVGAEAKGDLNVMDDTVLHPRLKAFWVGALGQSTPSFISSFAAAPLGTAQISNMSDRSWLEFGIGFDAKAGDGVTIGLGYDATLGRTEASYGAVTGRVRIVF